MAWRFLCGWLVQKGYITSRARVDGLLCPSVIST
jgi:hypothetical protein